MRLINTTTRPIVILPGESVGCKRFEVRLDANRDLKHLSLDRMADDYDVPPPADIVDYGEGEYGSVPDRLADSPPHTCPFPSCSYESETKKGVRVHHTKAHGKSLLNDDTPDPDEWVGCPECGDEFGTETGMKRHYSMVHGKRYDDVHGDDTPHECPTCGDRFRTEHGVKVHHGHAHGATIAEAGRSALPTLTDG